MSKDSTPPPEVMAGYCYHCTDYVKGTFHSLVGDQYVYVTGHTGCPGKPLPESTRPRRYSTPVRR